MAVKAWVFHITNLCLLLMMGSLVWSVAVPQQRIWPPKGKNSWQFFWMWLLTVLAWLGFNVLFFTRFQPLSYYPELRLYLGIPLFLLGAGFALWGVFTLGTHNSLGLRSGFISSGPYRFSRNPQYAGDIMLIMGMIILSGDLQVLISGTLAALCFFLGPFCEESWLEQQYRQEYVQYKSSTSRFF